MRGLIALCMIVFVVVLAVLAGHKLAAESLAVIVGVVCGVTASVPMAVLLLILMRAQQRSAAGSGQPAAGSGQPQYPPVIVVNSGGQPQPPPLLGGPAQTGGAVEGERRSFRLIGEDD